MGNSKLFVCIEIMKTVNQKGPQTAILIQAALGENAGAVRNCIDFLVQQGILRERVDTKVATYVNTKRAKRVLAYFNIRDADTIDSVPSEEH